MWVLILKLSKSFYNEINLLFYAHKSWLYFVDKGYVYLADFQHFVAKFWHIFGKKEAVGKHFRKMTGKGEFLLDFQARF